MMCYVRLPHESQLESKQCVLISDPINNLACMLVYRTSGLPRATRTAPQHKAWILASDQRKSYLIHAHGEQFFGCASGSESDSRVISADQR